MLLYNIASLKIWSFLIHVLGLSGGMMRQVFKPQSKSLGNPPPTLSRCQSPREPRDGRYLELYFNERRRIASAQALTYVLTNHLNHLIRAHEEWLNHVFYQFLVGAIPLSGCLGECAHPNAHRLF